MTNFVFGLWMEDIDCSWCAATEYV